MHGRLMKKALAAIEAVSKDASVSPETTLSYLEELSRAIDSHIEAIHQDFRLEEP